MPKKGSKARGISEVTGIGIGSKIHQMAVHKEIAAVIFIIEGMSHMARLLYSSMPSSGPNRLNRIRVDRVKEVLEGASNVMRVFVIIWVMEQFCLSYE
jgi:hypothetical protein